MDSNDDGTNQVVIVESDNDKQQQEESTLPKKVVDYKEIDLEDLDGVGPKTAKSIRSIGIESVMELAVYTPAELSTDMGIAKDTAEEYILAAQKVLRENKVLDKEFRTAKEDRANRKTLLKCTTGSKAFDDILKGGIETEAVTEFFGPFGSGKSQICHTLCCLAQESADKKGLGGAIIVLDTEGTFRSERVEEIALARGMDVDKILDNIIVCNIQNAAHLEMTVKDIAKYIEQYNAKMLIVDSIIAMHRAEFAGRGTLSDRQQRLNGIMHKLNRVAQNYKIAVIVTNQVQTSPDTFFGDPNKPTGGNVIGHASTYRIKLIKSGSDNIAKIIDSPYHAYLDCRFTVTNAGIVDVEDEKEKKKKKEKESE